MGRTPDRTPGISQEEGIVLEPSSTPPSVNGELRYVSGQGFKFFEEGVEKSLTGTGLSENDHRAIRQLIHFIEEGPAEGFATGAYKVVSPPGDPFPTSIIWYNESNIVTRLKIVEKTITRGSNQLPTQIQWKVYDELENLLATVTDSITYSNNVFENTRTRTIA